MNAYQIVPFQTATAVVFRERILSAIHVILVMSLTYPQVILDIK